MVCPQCRIGCQTSASCISGSRTGKNGIRRIAQKVGEEGVETALAAVVQGDADLLGEAADLLYHLTVLLRARGLAFGDAVRVLRERHAEGSAANDST